MLRNCLIACSIEGSTEKENPKIVETSPVAQRAGCAYLTRMASKIKDNIAQGLNEQKSKKKYRKYFSICWFVYLASRTAGRGVRT
jgi:hypothetical protein